MSVAIMSSTTSRVARQPGEDVGVCPVKSVAAAPTIQAQVVVVRRRQTTQVAAS